MTYYHPHGPVQERKVIVNVGLYRSGTTTLLESAINLGGKGYQKFPELSQQHEYKAILQNPQDIVLEWWLKGGVKEIIDLATIYDIICDGWISLLPFLPPKELQDLKAKAKVSGINLIFVATQRHVEGTVLSELQHWTIHNLEQQAGLSFQDRQRLEDDLRIRAVTHERCIQDLDSAGFLKILPLSSGTNLVTSWSQTLSEIGDFNTNQWADALRMVGKCNANPPTPMEGIMLTLRLGSDEEAKKKIECVERLLDQIEQDSLCRYLVVVAIDADEVNGSAATNFLGRLNTRATSQKQMQSLHWIVNPVRFHHHDEKPFPICSIWDEMAIVAWKEGADWVMLLGDDIDINCSFHYRAFYRSFLDISKHLHVPFGFGCPWWNDTSFPRFPTFPVVGKVHYKLFGSLIPQHRKENFINQDLDPYLHHLYLKFQATPCVSHAILTNTIGGNIGSNKARYKRIPAVGWRDFVLEDIDVIRNYLPPDTKEDILLDVIVPSYRVRLDYLQSICSLRVPDRVYVNFIVIVDNPDALLRSVQQIEEKMIIHTKTNMTTLDQAESILERYLSDDGNMVRVRCNKSNVGASASRNRDLDESAAEFVLHLDDDLFPNSDLLERYVEKLLEIDKTVVGLVGLVRFPRSSTLPLHHAAVLMSYLTFMFEIAERDMYQNPAWGVTANILFRRTHVRFDLVYAKTGGGEDVDYSLRVVEACNGGRLLSVPEARVVHPFWPGSVLELAKHFYSWAIGDGALFQRFPEHCYWSFPNIPEMVLIVMLPCLYWIGPMRFVGLILSFLLVDFIVDFSNVKERNHRYQLLQVNNNNNNEKEESNHNLVVMMTRRSFWFYFFAHILANLYVVVLECGRLRGHIGRRTMCFRYGIFRRFDWHIGRLSQARNNFRQRESIKFAGFLVLLAVFCSHS